MSQLNLDTLALSPTAQAARLEAIRIAKSQPAAKIGTKGSDFHHNGTRDTVESIVIAFILAFLFRTFIAEAFIIPTGSMAETLYGRHKDVVCTQCQTRFRVGASEEVDRDNSYFRPEGRVKYGFCPNCRFQMDIEDELPFAGDRILVNKFPYEFREPQRFDVVVFKFPEDPKINYIKRLIGLPGEAITVSGGDLFRQVGDLGKSEILRKPPRIQEETQSLIYDHDKPARVLLNQGFPERWAAVQELDPAVADPDGWKHDPENRVFTIDQSNQKAGSHSWIRYRHFVPQPSDWQQAFAGKRISPAPAMLLIADHFTYNSGYHDSSPVSILEEDAVGRHWVGDLTLHAEVEVAESKGHFTLELVEGRRKYHCDVDLSSGHTTLSYQDEQFRKRVGGELEDIPIGQATTITRPGKYRLIFANVDDRLILSVNGRWIQFTHDGQPVDGAYQYPHDPAERVPTHLDLSPIGIAARGTKMSVAHLRITRDIYYTNQNDPDRQLHRAMLQDPSKYATEYARSAVRDRFKLSEDEFFVLGDNSPRSQDSRMWSQRPFHPHAVNRNLLVGKAFLIYWPHGVPLGSSKGVSPYFGNELNHYLYY